MADYSLRENKRLSKSLIMSFLSQNTALRAECVGARIMKRGVECVKERVGNGNGVLFVWLNCRLGGTGHVEEPGLRFDRNENAPELHPHPFKTLLQTSSGLSVCWEEKGDVEQDRQTGRKRGNEKVPFRGKWFRDVDRCRQEV